MKCKKCGVGISQASTYYDEDPIYLCRVCYKLYKAWIEDHEYFQVMTEERNRGLAGDRVKDIDYPSPYYDYSTDDHNNLEYIQDTQGRFYAT